ncbi:SsgA family sporulation/cell division regulator [Streptomyces sp. SCPE 10]|uniref:SsgA family sporulation/cell division regulator n=1 Tax=Streptomyces sp. SCPE 10 TaxID=3449273 RepID=UPI003F7E10C0
MITCVDHMLGMELLSPLGGRVPVPTHLLYRAQDPLLVELLFHDPVYGPIPWVVSRELLARGMPAPSGEGDIRVWPTGTGPRALLHILPAPPDGSAHLVAPLPALAHWLWRTYKLVPAPRKADALDLDGRLDRFLEGLT